MVRTGERTRRSTDVYRDRQRYDLNNTLLSFGLHHRWKQITALLIPKGTVAARSTSAPGTVDLSLLVSPRLGPNGHVMAVDLNEAMLREGRRKIIKGD